MGNFTDKSNNFFLYLGTIHVFVIALMFIFAFKSQIITKASFQFSAIIILAQNDAFPE